MGGGVGGTILGGGGGGRFSGLNHFHYYRSPQILLKVISGVSIIGVPEDEDAPAPLEEVTVLVTELGLEPKLVEEEGFFILYP